MTWWQRFKMRLRLLRWALGGARRWVWRVEPDRLVRPEDCGTPFVPEWKAYDDNGKLVDIPVWTRRVP